VVQRSGRDLEGTSWDQGIVCKTSLDRSTSARRDDQLGLSRWVLGRLGSTLYITLRRYYYPDYDGHGIRKVKFGFQIEAFGCF
jgi:hypothetical protein